MNSTKLLRAINFAICKHDGQYRKGVADPYVTHTIDVAMLLISAGITDVDVLCAAVLHDTLEDTKTTFEELRALFGERVAALVSEVTDDKALNKLERKKAQIEHARTMSESAQNIKVGDKISNCRKLRESPPPNWSEEMITGYAVWSRAVVAAMPTPSTQLEDELFRVVDGILGFEADGAEDKYQAILDRYYELCAA